MPAESNQSLDDGQAGLDLAGRVQALLLEPGSGAQTSFAVLSEEHDQESCQILKSLALFPARCEQKPAEP